ncbi:Crp/Fnr family transcriptional regulator [Bosea sp. TAF32]|uniref:Crp/Fnr family transcriptional regulator n=1 Tax=Bosea sp. TAF32 TaxID=3237482 RepID=UPI003F911A65
MNQFNKEDQPIKLDPLDRVGWLADQPEHFRSWVANNARWRHFAAGEAIYNAGDEPNGMYGLASGALEVTFPLISDEPVTIYRAEPGFWIGEAALMAGATRLVGLSSALDSRVLHIPIGPLRELLEHDPGYWRILYEQSFANLGVALTLLAEALALTPRARIAKLLLRLADGEGRVQGNQDDFGRLIGMTRSSVRRALLNIAEAGFVRTGYRSLEIVDAEALKKISREG